MKIGNVTDVHAAQFPLLCLLINYLHPRKNDADKKMKILIVGDNFSKTTIINKEIK